jgi:hypothetical protein
MHNRHCGAAMSGRLLENAVAGYFEIDPARKGDFSL